MTPNKDDLVKTYSLIADSFAFIANSKFDGINGKRVGECLQFLDDMASKLQKDIQELQKAEDAESVVSAMEAPQESEEDAIKRKWDEANSALMNAMEI